MVTRKTTRVVVTCPECDEDFSLTGKVEWGKRVVCPHCDTDLEVINTNPLEVDWVYEDSGYQYEDEDEEDW